MQTYIIVIISVLFNTVAQLLLKFGLKNFGDFTLDFAHIGKLITSIFTNWYLFGGMCCFVGSVLLWLVVLTKLPVSIAYPMGSLGYLFTLVFAYFLLNEPITMLKIIGILLICGGVIVLSQSR